MRSITARLAPNVASGKPPPMDLARQMMSGLTPKNSLAPPQASFAPVFTSSKMSNAPLLSQRSRNPSRSEEHTSELQSHSDLVCRLLLEKKKKKKQHRNYDQHQRQRHT